jgi:hypothetical protein
MGNPVSLFGVSSLASDVADLMVSRSVPAAAKAIYGQVFDAAALSRISALIVKQPPRFDASDLYGVGGKPRDVDIDQDSLSDCYFVATLAAIADKQPQRIQNAIKYDPATETFNVTLYKEEWSWNPPGMQTKAVVIPVTQQDLLDNISRRGGSTVDNNPGTDGPIWPAVLETAFAKMNDSNWSNGLTEGYNNINGGFGRDAMFALTGDKGTDYKGYAPFPVNIQADILYTQINYALSEGRPVTLSTDPERRTLLDFVLGQPGRQDGLSDDHVYSVERIYKDASGKVMVELRNPWGNNLNVGEGADTASAIITVPLERLLETGGLECFNVGPRP